MKYLIFIFMTMSALSQEIPKDYRWGLAETPWVKIEIGMNEMPESNPSQFNQTKANIMHESKGAFTGNHLVFTKNDDGTVLVRFEFRDGGKKESKILTGVSFAKILKKFERLDYQAALEGRSKKTAWNPNHRLRLGYRFTMMKGHKLSLSCGIITDSHTPESFKSAREFLGKLSKKSIPKK